MIELTSLKKLQQNKYDAVWSIVRSSKPPRPGILPMPALAPTKELTEQVKRWRQQNQWTPKTFEEKYKPQYLRYLKLNENARSLLDTLDRADASYQKIALVCVCENPHCCHRSILAEVLKGRGCDVILS